jgi:hypothetical protein
MAAWPTTGPARETLDPTKSGVLGPVAVPRDRAEIIVLCFGSAARVGHNARMAHAPNFKLVLTRTIEPSGGPGAELATLEDAAGYHVHRLVERYGIDAKLFDWSDEITADCPRRHSKTSAARGTRTCRRWCEAPLHNEARVHYQRTGRAKCE